MSEKAKRIAEELRDILRKYSDFCKKSFGYKQKSDYLLNDSPDKRKLKDGLLEAKAFIDERKRMLNA